MSRHLDDNAEKVTQLAYAGGIVLHWTFDGETTLCGKPVVRIEPPTFTMSDGRTFRNSAGCKSCNGRRESR